MKRSTEAFLTTHTGSLPRPPDLLHMIEDSEAGRPVSQEAFEVLLRSAVFEVVGRQREAGLDLINDGEASKPGYATYAKDRLTGFSGEGALPVVADVTDFPDYGARFFSAEGLRLLKTPACTGPVAHRDEGPVRRDVANLKAALEQAGVPVESAFMTASSPGVMSLFLTNHHYPDRERYLADLAEAMRVEYRIIHEAGLVLQLDCPDLAMGRHIEFAAADLDTFRREARRNVEALNHAIRDIPPEAMRIHVCWGNYEGPHHRDVALREVLDVVLEARPAAISFPAANPRHEHEWRVFEEVSLPEGKTLIPGVIDSTTNFIEHPDLVAERISRFADVVGPEKVVAGTDCGFATFASFLPVDPAIAWAKLQALAEGARIASRRHFG